WHGSADPERQRGSQEDQDRQDLARPRRGRSPGGPDCRRLQRCSRKGVGTRRTRDAEADRRPPAARRHEIAVLILPLGAGATIRYCPFPSPRGPSAHNQFRGAGRGLVCRGMSPPKKLLTRCHHLKSSEWRSPESRPSPGRQRNTRSTLAEFGVMSELDTLIQLLAKLPGLGPRSAPRAALHLVKRRGSPLQ